MSSDSVHHSDELMNSFKKFIKAKKTMWAEARGPASRQFINQRPLWHKGRCMNTSEWRLQTDTIGLDSNTLNRVKEDGERKRDGEGKREECSVCYCYLYESALSHQSRQFTLIRFERCSVDGCRV